MTPSKLVALKSASTFAVGRVCDHLEELATTNAGLVLGTALRVMNRYLLVKLDASCDTWLLRNVLHD
jgi:hypothetical protein